MKQKLQLIATTALLMLCGHTMNAQVWTGSAVATYTGDNTNIGLAAPTNAAKLNLYNQEWYNSGNNIPTFRIKRDIVGDMVYVNYNETNIMEIWSQNKYFNMMPMGPEQLRLAFTNYGYMGINDAAPSTRLTLRDGDFSMPRTSDNEARNITALSDKGMMYLSTNLGGNHPLIQMGAVNNGWRPGQIWYHSSSPQGWPAQMFLDWSHTTNNWVGIMRLVEDNGVPKVTIGNVNDLPGNGSYTLFVERGILTEKVKVALSSSSDWSDYVFADDYKLMPLTEVAEYIKENKHLPSIPSADEVVKEGIDLGAMDAKLLQKIEELTLHMIQMQQTNDELKARLSKLENN